MLNEILIILFWFLSFIVLVGLSVYLFLVEKSFMSVLCIMVFILLLVGFYLLYKGKLTKCGGLNEM